MAVRLLKGFKIVIFLFRGKIDLVGFNKMCIILCSVL